MCGSHTDFHTHILPGIDDGSKSISESLQMIASEYEQGIRRIVLTPHFYADRDGRDYLPRREKRYRALKEALADSEYSDVTLNLGAEVCFFDGVGKADIVEHLCVDGSRLLLLEMPFSQWTESVLDEVKTLIFDRNFEVMIAHIERYDQHQRSRYIWDEVFSLPVIPQINAKSLIGGRFKTRKVYRYIKSDDRIVLSTDCHNMSTRRPNIAEGRAELERICGSDRLKRIDEMQQAAIDIIDESRV